MEGNLYKCPVGTKFMEIIEIVTIGISGHQNHKNILKLFKYLLEKCIFKLGPYMHIYD